MTNALPYILLTLFYAIMANARHFAKTDKIKIYIDASCVAMFLFFFGFRGFVKYDWAAYYPQFMDLKGIGDLISTPLAKWPWEPGFTIFAALVRQFFSAWQAFVLICAVIDIALLVRFFRKFNISLPLGLMMFMAMNGTAMTMDTIRNIITILLFCNAIPYLIDRRPLPYFLICALAITFHKSSVIYILLYFILHRRINKWILLSVFGVSCAIYVMGIPILKDLLTLVMGGLSDTANQYINTYLGYDKTSGGLSIGFLERFFTGALTFLYIGKLRATRKGNDVFINSLYLFLCLFLLLSEFRTISMRASMIFSYAYWIIWIDLIDCFKFRNNKVLFVIFLAIYCLLKAYSENKAAVNKYENVLIGDTMNYNQRLLYFNRHFNDED